MVGLLWLAHDEACEADLAIALTAILDAGALPDLTALKARFQRPVPEQQDVRVTMPATAAYDALLASQGAAA
jgi:nitrogen fixation protein FixH